MIEPNGMRAGDAEIGVVLGDDRVLGCCGVKFISVADSAGDDGVGKNGATGNGGSGGGKIESGRPVGLQGGDGSAPSGTGLRTRVADRKK
jgi:hypothetical protein